MTKTKLKPAILYFQIKSNGCELIKKLFIVKHNGQIALHFIPRQMGELQRRLNGRRRLDQVSLILIWLVLSCNLLFSSQCLNDKWPQSAISIFIEARGDPSPLQLENARRPWVAILISSLPPLGPSLLAIPGQWVMEEKRLTWLSSAGYDTVLLYHCTPLSRGRSSFHVWGGASLSTWCRPRPPLLRW